MLIFCPISCFLESRQLDRRKVNIRYHVHRVDVHGVHVYGVWRLSRTVWCIRVVWSQYWVMNFTWLLTIFHNSIFHHIEAYTVFSKNCAKNCAKTVQKLCIKLPCFDYFSNCMFLYSKNFEKWEVWSLSDVTGFFLLAYFRYFGRNKRYVNYLQNVGILKMWLNHFVSINFDSIP